MKTILLLDDERAVRKAERHMLKPYTVLQASSAEQALLLFKTNRLDVTLLIADVSSLSALGFQAALILRLENPALPVILTSVIPMSGWDEQEVAYLKRLQPESVVILQKPFSREHLLNTVRGLIGLPQSERVSTA